MTGQSIPKKLRSLYVQEEKVLRLKAEEFVANDENLALHLHMTEHAMDLADLLRQVPIEDEDIKVIKMLGMRMFNAFGASVKLALSGYGQNSALIMRDILETVFLLDLFESDRTKIEQWRTADKKDRMKMFLPVQVRKALDERDDFQGKKRAEVYQMFSELAAHPTIQSVFMMRPQKDGDAVIGPFIEASSLEAVLSELGRLAVQAGEVLDSFFPKTWDAALPARDAFARLKGQWLETFYSSTT